MLLTTGIIALSRKVKDERDRRREARQGLLRVGDSQTAKQAFAAQNVTEDGVNNSRNIARSGTEIKFEHPADVEDISSGHAQPESSRALIAAPATLSTNRHQDFTASPSSPSSSYAHSPRDSNPPPYSPGTPRSSVYSIESPGATTLSKYDSDTQSVSSGRVSVTADSEGTKGVRIRTKGAELKSGFAYHPSLFDLHVRPDQWERFTSQVVESTKFGVGDHAQMWAAATATALTGAVLTSIHVGRSMNRSLQEQKVRSGLQDDSDGGLGDTLKRWNETEFRDLGLFVHLELSESAMKRQNQKHHSFRKPISLYSRREDRERKMEERKFCIVVTKLDEEGIPSEALHELAEEEARVSEMSDPRNVIYEVPELPGDDGRFPIELPAGVALGYTSDKVLAPPSGYAELESDSVQLPEKANIDEKPVKAQEDDDDDDDDDDDGSLTPAPLMVTAETHAALNKELT